jgi:hypothetical protein
MSSDETGSAASTQSRPVGQRVKRGLESKVLVPLATTIVSAAASYLLRKLPLIIEERVLPKLREQGGAGAVRDAVTAVAEQASEVVPGLGGAGTGGEDDDGAAPDPSGEQQQSNEERENERREREERRRERRRAVQRT